MITRTMLGLILSVMLLLQTAKPGLAYVPEPLDPSEADRTSVSPGATAPWYIKTVDPTSGVGSHVSVAIDANGATYISYYDATNKDLKMAKHVGSGGNCGLDNNWSCGTVDYSNDVGRYSSIAIDPTTNLPVIAYWDMTLPYELKLATAWSGGWNIATIDPGAGGYASLAVDSTGVAHIAYQHAGYDNYLKYAKRVSGGTGNCGGNNYQCGNIDDGSNVGRYPSLALDASGQPRIAYFRGTGDTGLWYAKPSASGNCGPGGNTWRCDLISSSPNAGYYASLAVDSSDRPHIAYYDSGNLVYTFFKGLVGGNCGPSSTWLCDVIDDIGTQGHKRDVSLALDGAGSPVIVYHTYILGKYTNVSMNLARPAEALGLQTGNCGPQKSWQCTRSREHQHSGDYLSIAVNPAGLATVAYYNYNPYDGATLKVTYQQFHVISLPVVVLKNE